MKIINNTIYVEFQELVNCGVKEVTIRQAKQRDSKSWRFIDDPEDKRRVLIDYSVLKDSYKNVVINRICGGVDPYLWLKRNWIETNLIITEKDREALENFIMSNNTHLPKDKITAYLVACKYLNLLVNTSIKEVKKAGFKDSKEFYGVLIGLIKSNKIELPGSYNKLQEKKREYLKKGAVCVVSKKYGTQNARKITEAQQQYILEMFSKANQFSVTQIQRMVNNISKERNGWEPVTVQTVANYRNEYLTMNFREGVGNWRNKFDLVVRRQRPKWPNSLWVGDGTPFELYYTKRITKPDCKTLIRYDNRLVIYAVTDAFNDNIVGYAIGETENANLAKEAFRNACLNTGCLPNQIKTDNYATKALTPFYERICNHYTPSVVGNARDKTIEATFAKIYDWVTRVHINASGRNITAKNQPNRDYLMKVKKQFPGLDEVIDCIEFDVWAWNNMVVEGVRDVSLQQQYNEGDHSRDNMLSDLQRLELFGYEHKHLNRLTNKGLAFQLNGEKRYYLNLTPEFWDTVGTQYQVVYNPENFDKILIKTPDEKVKFLCEYDEKTPMDFAGHSEGSRTKLNKKLDFKKAMKERVMQEAEQRREILNKNALTEFTEAEGIAKAMFPVSGDAKQGLYEAQNKLKALDNTYDEYDMDINFEEKEDKPPKTFDDGY